MADGALARPDHRRELLADHRDGRGRALFEICKFASLKETRSDGREVAAGDAGPVAALHALGRIGRSAGHGDARAHCPIERNRVDDRHAVDAGQSPSPRRQFGEQRVDARPRKLARRTVHRNDNGVVCIETKRHRVDVLQAANEKGCANERHDGEHRLCRNESGDGTGSMYAARLPPGMMDRRCMGGGRIDRNTWTKPADDEQPARICFRRPRRADEHQLRGACHGKPEVDRPRSDAVEPFGCVFALTARCHRVPTPAG